MQIEQDRDQSRGLLIQGCESEKNHGRHAEQAGGRLARPEAGKNAREDQGPDKGEERTRDHRLGKLGGREVCEKKAVALRLACDLLGNHGCRGHRGYVDAATGLLGKVLHHVRDKIGMSAVSGPTALRALPRLSCGIEM